MTVRVSDDNARHEWAHALGISQHAVDLYTASDVIDLHVDSFIWTRLFGYDVARWHSPGWLRARFCRQVDIPRLRQAKVTGATWVITTNPWRSARGRARVVRKNLQRIRSLLDAQSDQVQVVRTLGDYQRAKQLGLHAAFLGIQGANALEDPSSWDLLDAQPWLLVTLVHLTNSRLGKTSSPLRLCGDRPISDLARELIERLNRSRTLLDLAHASPLTFETALRANDPALPVIVSHTGVAGVHSHWRNLSDQQLKQIAATGGIVGIFFFGSYLGGGLLGGSVLDVARHIKHAVRVIGADHVALGSDWDGMIRTPLDMPTCLELPRLVQALLDLGLSDAEIHSVLGASFLRLLGRVRP